MIEISKDKEQLNVAFIHSFLTNAYWAKGRTVAEVQNSIDHSLCFGLYLNDAQIGFARVATDYTVFVYVMDVFIDPMFRGKGYFKALMKTIIDDPELKNCKTWMLKTSDAHDLYKQFGFVSLDHPDKVMERILL